MVLLQGNLPQTDMEEILVGVDISWEKFRLARIAIFGGTGFIGTWLTSALLHANRELSLRLQITLPTRNLENLNSRLQILKSDPISVIPMDITKVSNFEFGAMDYYVHSATPSVSSTGALDEQLVRDTTVQGTRKILKHIEMYPTYPNFLHMSSGAVYGRQGTAVPRQSESVLVDVLQPLDNYATSKREAEKLIEEATEFGLLNGCNPRLYSFLGPFIATNEHFAVGNFIKDGLEKKRIQVKGNPKTVRSYLYPTDLMIWLIKLLAEPTITPINIGSDIGITMHDLANEISLMTSRLGVELLNPQAPESRYVPSVENIYKRFNLKQEVSRVTGLERWIKWFEVLGKS